jgi:hypothetical protein
VFSIIRVSYIAANGIVQDSEIINPDARSGNTLTKHIISNPIVNILHNKIDVDLRP